MGTCRTAGGCCTEVAPRPETRAWDWMGGKRSPLSWFLPPSWLPGVRSPCSKLLSLALQDSLVYLLNREQHTVGQRTQASKPSISLSAPDILPLHCTIRRLKLSGRTRNRAEDKLLLEPILGASVAVNFSEVSRTIVLHHGDLLSLGLYYLLLYKDPVKAQPLPAQSLMRLKSLHRASDPELPSACKLCGSLLKERGSSSKKRGPSPATGRRAAKQKLQLEFERAVEDVLLRRILTLIEPGGDDHKLTPAFLLCLCIQHSAAAFEPGDFGQLLLKAAKMIQRTVWVSPGAVRGELGRGVGG